MRRLGKGLACVLFVWFGLHMLLGGGMIYRGEAARAWDKPAAFSAVYYERETLPLLGEPAGMDETDFEAEGPSEVEEADRKGGGTAGVPGAGRKADSAEVRHFFGSGEGGSASGEESQPAETAAPGKIVYLTFDDGPSKHTPEVLDLLKKEGIQATFFVTGQQVDNYPDIAKRIVEEGHAIGNHTYNHVYEQLYGGFGAFAEQVMQTDESIYQATGVRTPLFRAPGGTYTNFDRGYFEAMKEAGYIVHDWNVDSGDSKRRGVPASEIVANVKASKLADVLNVLLHDSGGHEASVKALPEIIRYYKQLGYAFRPLTEHVEPIQFQTASRIKWNRGPVAASERAALAEYANAWTRTARIGPADSGGRNEPSLFLHFGAERLELEPGSYELIGGSIHVPVARLAEWMGARVERDERTGLIEAVLGGQSLFWLEGESGAAPSDPAGDELLVPIRSTLGQFGAAVVDYVYTGAQREVWIGQRQSA